MNTTLAKGDFVRCSDGTPQPPAHHKKKLRLWQCRNFTGWIHCIETESTYARIGIDQRGTGILVNMIDPTYHTITKETPPVAHSSERSDNAAFPTTPIMHHKKSNSPWGKVDGWSAFGDLGLFQHSTAGHGGIYVPAEMLSKMPAPYREANGGDHWFEEDCDWSLVALSFPSGLDEKTMEYARQAAKNWHPHAYMAVTGETLTREDSSVLAKEADRAAAVGKYVVIGASGAGKSYDRIDVPPGMVGCTAVIGGRNEHGSIDESTLRHFLVPADEYATRSSFGFIMHKEYPAWPEKKSINITALSQAQDLFAA